MVRLRNKECICVVSCLNLLLPHTNLHGNAAMTPASARQRRPHDQQLQNDRPELEKTNWPPSLPYSCPPPKHTHTQTRTLPPTPGCVLRLYGCILYHKTQIFTQPIHCVSSNNPLSLCWWKVEVDGVRSVQRGKREECLPALSSNVVFSFPAVSGQ